MMAVTAAAVCGQADGAAVRYAYQAGLEGLPRAETVRLVASREDRRAVCSLVLGVPLDIGSAGSARLQACYALFRREAAALCAQAEGGAGGEAGGARAVAALEAAARGALERAHVVVFELPDGVAAESMYELFAQRERALGSLFCTFSGVAMGEADLVRNLLLAHVADEEARTTVEAGSESRPCGRLGASMSSPSRTPSASLLPRPPPQARVEAYDTLWLPLERRHGDGRPDRLEAFLRHFLDQQLDQQHAAPAAAVAPATLDQSSVSSSVAADAARAAAGGTTFDRFAALLASLGGNRGGSLYSAGDGAALVEGGEEAAAAAAVGLLRRMLATPAQGLPPPPQDSTA